MTRFDLSGPIILDADGMTTRMLKTLIARAMISIAGTVAAQKYPNKPVKLPLGS